MLLANCQLYTRTYRYMLLAPVLYETIKNKVTRVSNNYIVIQATKQVGRSSYQSLHSELGKQMHSGVE